MWRRPTANYLLMFNRNLLTASDVKAQTSTGNFPVSFLDLFFFWRGKVNILHKDNIPGDTPGRHNQGGADFDSTGRCFHMFPKRMKGRGSSSQTCVRDS